MTFGDFTDAATAINWVQTDPANAALTTQQQQIVAGLVTPVSEFIRTYTNRWIGPPQDFEEVRDGTGRGRFTFANFPVQAVLLVVVDGVTIPAIPPVPPAPPGMVISTFPYGRAGYAFTPTKLIIQGYRVPRWPLCVQLQYTAGYPTIPTDLAQACLEIIALTYRVRLRVGVSQEQVQGIGSRTYITNFEMPPSAQATLDRYRAVAPVSGFCRVLAPTPTDPATIVGAI